jgi:hypothetical protein
MAKLEYGKGTDASAGQFGPKSDQGLDSGLIQHPGWLCQVILPQS